MYFILCVPNRRDYAKEISLAVFVSWPSWELFCPSIHRIHSCNRGIVHKSNWIGNVTSGYFEGRNIIGGVLLVRVYSFPIFDDHYGRTIQWILPMWFIGIAVKLRNFSKIVPKLAYDRVTCFVRQSGLHFGLGSWEASSHASRCITGDLQLENGRPVVH